MYRARSSSSATSLLPPSLASYVTRLGHQLGDLATTAGFGLCPFPSWPTTLRLQTHDHKKLHLRLDQWTSLGSGGFVWGGARTLAQQLQTYDHGTLMSRKEQGNGVHLPWAGLRVIELGAGTGALGISIAATLGANSVTLTDQAAFVYPRYRNTTANNSSSKKHHKQEMARDQEILALEQEEQEQLQKRSLLDLIQTNVDNNHEVLSNTPTNIQVREMVWGNDNNEKSRQCLAGLPHATYDVIVASDVLVFQEGQEDLLATMRHLSTPQTIILLGHTDRGTNNNSDNVYPNDLLNFFQLLDQDKEVSWIPHVVQGHGRYFMLRIERQG